MATENRSNNCKNQTSNRTSNQTSNRTSNQTTNYGMVMAGATLTFLFPFTLYIFLQKQFVEGIAMGGVKG